MSNLSVILHTPLEGIVYLNMHAVQVYKAYRFKAVSTHVYLSSPDHPVIMHDGGYVRLSLLSNPVNLYVNGCIDAHL